MKTLHGESSAFVQASVEECIAVLAAVGEYPRWYPDVVREARVTERADDGAPTRADVTLHVARGPIRRDFHLAMRVEVTPRRVLLARIARDPSDEEQFAAAWEVADEGACRRIRLDVDAVLDVPRLVPLGGVGDELAAGFTAAAASFIDRHA